MAKTVLVVEDDNDSRMALCAMLEGLGYNPLAFASGKEALVGITGQQLDIALLDVMMPEMNGFQVLQAMRADPAWKELPIILVTARDGDSEVLEGYQHGADYYITKPYTTEQLRYGLELYLVP